VVSPARETVGVQELCVESCIVGILRSTHPYKRVGRRRVIVKNKGSGILHHYRMLMRWDIFTRRECPMCMYMCCLITQQHMYRPISRASGSQQSVSGLRAAWRYLTIAHVSPTWPPVLLAIAESVSANNIDLYTMRVLLFILAQPASTVMHDRH
jgi:hypothetical protein